MEGARRLRLSARRAGLAKSAESRKVPSRRTLCRCNSTSTLRNNSSSKSHPRYHPRRPPPPPSLAVVQLPPPYHFVLFAPTPRLPLSPELPSSPLLPPCRPRRRSNLRVPPFRTNARRRPPKQTTVLVASRARTPHFARTVSFRLPLSTTRPLPLLPSKVILLLSCKRPTRSLPFRTSRRR